MTHHAHARAVRRSCGKYLADRIYDICKARGGYSQLSAAPSTTTTTRAPELSHRRVRRGVVEECCRQSCTDATLIQYCMESAVESAENAQFGGGLDPNKSAMPSPTERSTNTVIVTKWCMFVHLTYGLICFRFSRPSSRSGTPFRSRWAPSGQSSTTLMQNMSSIDGNSTTNSLTSAGGGLLKVIEKILHWMKYGCDYLLSLEKNTISSHQRKKKFTIFVLITTISHRHGQKPIFQPFYTQ